MRLIIPIIVLILIAVAAYAFKDVLFGIGYH
jgi:hypothetical protein